MEYDCYYRELINVCMCLDEFRAFLCSSILLCFYCSFFFLAECMLPLFYNVISILRSLKCYCKREFSADRFLLCYGDNPEQVLQIPRVVVCVCVCVIVCQYFQVSPWLRIYILEEGDQILCKKCFYRCFSCTFHLEGGPLPKNAIHLTVSIFSLHEW